MKKILYLSMLLIASTIYAQPGVISKVDRLKVLYNPKSLNATRVMVQDTVTKEVGWILKSNFQPVNTKEILEYADQASFPVTGTTGIIYVATNDAGNGVPEYFIWNGSAYVSDTQPLTTLTGSGISNHLSRWLTPTQLGSSRILDDPLSSALFINSSRAPLSGGSQLSIQRASGQSQMDFTCGNPGFNSISSIISNNTDGFSFHSYGDIFLNTGNTGTERLRVLQSNGNIGIGTATPAEKLSVAGNLFVTGGIKDSTGSFGTSGQVLKSTVTGTQWGASGSPTGAALTKTDDTNVTLTLGGTPASALLVPASITVGWTGTLADSRIASAATWNAKEGPVTATTSADYYRGDKTFQPLNKAAVGLPNADNTADTAKPVSTAQKTYIDAETIKRQLREGKIEFAGKNINFTMDSYGTGSIVTFPTTQKLSTLVAQGVGGTEVTRAFSGSTVQKRTPVNWAGGTATNLIDEMVNIPAYNPATTSILVIALGTNDAGQTAAAYTTANFNTDYSTALTYINGTKGYPFDRILLISPYYVNSTGYTSYAALTSNAAPTLARFEAFVAETKTVAETFGTMYLDVFHDEANNNTTATAISGDGIHKTTYGHAFIAHDILGYLGQTSLLFGVKTNSTVSNPTCINLGGTNSSANTPSAGKIIFYDNGGTGIYSIGISADFDFYKGAASKFNFWDNTTRIASMNNSGFGFGVVPTAKFHAAASTASASTGQLKLDNSASAPSTPERGLINHLNDNLTFDAGSSPVRYTLAKTLTNTAALDFPSTATGVTSTLTITVTNAADGDVVAIGVPAASSIAGAVFWGQVTSANTVTIYYTNTDASTHDPASGTFRASVIKY